MAFMYAYNLDTLFTCFLDIISFFTEVLTANMSELRRSDATCVCLYVL